MWERSGVYLGRGIGTVSAGPLGTVAGFANARGLKETKIFVCGLWSDSKFEFCALAALIYREKGGSSFTIVVFNIIFLNLCVFTTCSLRGRLFSFVSTFYPCYDSVSHRLHLIMRPLTI